MGFVNFLEHTRSIMSIDVQRLQIDKVAQLRISKILWRKRVGAFLFSGSGQLGLVFPAKAGPYMTVAYGNLLVAEPYGFPPARERRENEKALTKRVVSIDGVACL